MKISIVTLNYNGSESTIKLLKSLRNQTDNDFRIIVVDNASEGADFNNLRAYSDNNFSDVQIIRNSQNLGFSGGNNTGAKEALKNGANWVFLLNNDTWVEPGFMASLKAKIGGLGGVAGVPLVEQGKAGYPARSRMSYCGRVKWLKPRGYHVHDLDTKRKMRNEECYVIGGAMLIHGSVLEKIGLLDENYFLYFEDNDFSLRAQRAGFPITILEEPAVYHQPSSTAKKLGPSLLLRYHYRNSFYFNWKNGPWYIKILVWPWSLWVMKKQLLKITLGYKKEESQAILSGVFDWYKNKMGQVVNFSDAQSAMPKATEKSTT